jgi:hypothetical protein
VGRARVVACALSALALIMAIDSARGQRGAAGDGDTGAARENAMPAHTPTIVMRSGLPPPVGRYVSISAAGLVVETGETGGNTSSDEGVTGGVGGTRRVVVALDAIAEPPPALAREFEPLRRLAEVSWRARIRLERGDFVSAEPLLDEAASELTRLGVGLDAGGPTAERVYRGLVRCRAARGMHAGALEAFLSWRVVAERVFIDGGAGLAADLSADGSVDPVTLLATQLPPMWIDGPATQAFARTVGGADGLGGDAGADAGGNASSPARALARLYVAAARDDSGLTLPDGWDPRGADAGGTAVLGDEGVRLVRDIVAARVGDEATRSAAREALASRLTGSMPAWRRAWVLAGVGRSLTRETDRERRLRGVATLLEIPATVERACPYVTGLAMAEAAATLADLGDGVGAERVRAELAARLPGHAALASQRLRTISAPASAQPAPASRGADGGG